MFCSLEAGHLLRSQPRPRCTSLWVLSQMFLEADCPIKSHYQSVSLPPYEYIHKYLRRLEASWMPHQGLLPSSLGALDVTSGVAQWLLTTQRHADVASISLWISHSICESSFGLSTISLSLSLSIYFSLSLSYFSLSPYISLSLSLSLSLSISLSFFFLYLSRVYINIW